MKTSHFCLLLLLFVTSLISSCATSDSVVGNGLIQKRKYTSGWFVTKSPNIKPDNKTDRENGQELALENSSPKEHSNGNHSANSYAQKPETQQSIPTAQQNFESKEKNNVPSSDQATDDTDGKEISAVHEGVSVESVADNEPVSTVDDNTDQINKAAFYGFWTFLGALLFLIISLALADLEPFFLLILGLLLLVISLILTIRALTKFKHLQKRKVFAYITLYTIVLGPLLLLAIGLVYAASVWG